MTTSRSLRFGAALLLALAVACSSDTTAPVSLPASLDQIFSEASLSSISAINGGLAPVPVSTFAMPAPSTCSYSAGTFVCPTVTIGELQFSRKFTLYDESGAVQSQFVSGVTSRIRFESSAHGVVTSGTSGFAVDQTHDLLVSGLTSSTHLLNGTSRTAITTVVPAGSTATPTTTTLALAFNNLELPKGGNAYPGGGNINLTATSSNLGAAPFHMQLAFNGTSKVAVTTDVGGISLPSCTLDLSVANPTCR
jgi:Tfp pilus assembly protein FimT